MKTYAYEITETVTIGGETIVETAYTREPQEVGTTKGPSSVDDYTRATFKTMPVVVKPSEGFVLAYLGSRPVFLHKDQLHGGAWSLQRAIQMGYAIVTSAPVGTVPEQPAPNVPSAHAWRDIPERPKNFPNLRVVDTGREPSSRWAIVQNSQTGAATLRQEGGPDSHLAVQVEINTYAGSERSLSLPPSTLVALGYSAS